MAVRKAPIATAPHWRGIEAVLGDRLTYSNAICEHHGRGEGYHKGMPPDAVGFPHGTEEVSKIVAICRQNDVPIVAFGVGTSLEGHVAAVRGGLCLDFSQMNAVLDVSSDDMDCLVEPGVTRKQLNNHLRDTGLFFPIDPGADATLGGMTATRASGTNAVRYGTMRENVLGLEVVLADGSIIQTGGRARKSSAGYDLTRLMVGSEGTLGIITKIRLRLAGIPEAISSAVCPYPTVGDAVNAVISTIQCGIPVARIEFLDSVQMGACIAYSKLQGYEPRPTLFYEFHGSDNGVREQAQMAQDIAGEFGGEQFRWTANPEDRNKLWQARHDAYYAACALAPGKRAWPTDICVPISRLAEAVDETAKDIEASGLLAPMVGHVGDGNIHLQFLIDPENTVELEKAQFVNKRMVDRAIALGGTCTGEHGIGLGKMDCLVREHGSSVEWMRSIKNLFDPTDILNPGKIVQPD